MLWWWRSSCCSTRASSWVCLRSFRRWILTLRFMFCLLVCFFVPRGYGFRGRMGVSWPRRHASAIVVEGMRWTAVCEERSLCLHLCGKFVCETVEFLVVEGLAQFLVWRGNAFKFLSTWHETWIFLSTWHETWLVGHVLSRQVGSFLLNFIQSANSLIKYR